MTEPKEDPRLSDSAGWTFARDPDGKVERTSAPKEMSLCQSVEWIKKNKPILWTGSIFSAPPPSNFPSGLTLTTNLLELVIEEPPDNPDAFALLARQWPLEMLLDLLDKVADKFSRSLLTFFRQHDLTASPNSLHRAVAEYYRRGLAGRPLCITVNWDTLQERAFRDAGLDVVVGSPRIPATEGFGEKSIQPGRVFLYHAHGSFDHSDVICSYIHEIRQLSGSHATSYFSHLVDYPTLFLGYSGYEPSMYDVLLVRNEGELWVVWKNDELNIPLKRRLLCRPNCCVYVDDLRKLLKAIGVLENDVEFTSDEPLDLARIPIPPGTHALMQFLTRARADATFCSTEMISRIARDPEDPRSEFAYNLIMRELLNHMRNTPRYGLVLAALLSAAAIRNTPQTWISILACLLRSVGELDLRVVNGYLDRARKALGGRKRIYSQRDVGAFSRGVAAVRADIYAQYLGYPNRFNQVKGPNWKFGCSKVAEAFGDLGAAGELMEVLAFLTLRNGDPELATRYFDYAADRYYLQGLWEAGARTEWASFNVEQLQTTANAGSLAIGPIDSGLLRPSLLGCGSSSSQR